MIGISRLYCGVAEPSDHLRYPCAASEPPEDAQRSGDPSRCQGSQGAPTVVVWNCTWRCNLRCRHCYSQSDLTSQRELTTDQGRKLIDDLAEFGVRVLLMSGGEPLLRGDLGELVRHGAARGLRVVVSTNGTLMTPERAAEIASLGVAYVGVSLDGGPEANDSFRGVPGAFTRALDGIRACREAGLRVGLRFTIHRGNVAEIGPVFDLVRRERIPRVCFYHLVYAGRGSALIGEDLSHEEARDVMDLIMSNTAELHARGTHVQVLTVDNRCDGPYVYLRLLREDPERAREAMRLLRAQGATLSGTRIACVSWDGSVHPDQFWRHYTVGNVLGTPFSRIWTDEEEPLLAKLRRRTEYVRGRCASCRWLDVCGGSSRVRALAATGDLWAPDPACYLTDEEIAS